MMRHIAPAIRHIIVPGRKAMKTGVVLFELEDAAGAGGDLFRRPDARNLALAGAMDEINRRYGRDTLFLAGEGVKREWSMKREFLSRRFTTNWNELPEVR